MGRIEEEVRGLDGVKRVLSGASERFGQIYIELLLGANGNKLLADVKNAVESAKSAPWPDVEEVDLHVFA